MGLCEVCGSKKKQVNEDHQYRDFYIHEKGYETDQTIYANLFSSDLPINITIPCSRADKFSKLEEKLYQYYPELKYNNLYFIHNDNLINRLLTIGENEINNGEIITIKIKKFE